MPELLIEVGCEELPAVFVRRAYTDLQDNLLRLLGEANLIQEGSQATSLGTPRRLIVSISDVKDRQEDSLKEQRGPALKAAFDADDKPTPALLGFCRSQGIEVSDLRRDDQYVWVTKKVEGRAALDLLSELLPQAIRGLNFEKSMRWGHSRMRFARPIRWLLASFGGTVVPFDIEGVQAGLESKGHRFYAPDAFPASDFAGLISGLRARKVEPDPDIRRTMIVDGAKSVATGTVELTPALVEENVFLTEWPTAILGEFKTEYQVLPTSVLITAMAKHEKMFPVRDTDRALTNQFVFIRNSGEDGTVRRGNEWVLNARFNDAKFFHDEDAKHTMADFLEKTANIIFQEKLGTVRQRADRLSQVASEVATAMGASTTEAEFAKQAGLYAKADLSSGLVSELSSLQGVIGGEYARREGMPGEVCWAIGSQYDLSKNPNPGGCSGERTAIQLIIADQLDKLAGYLGIGLEPSGSSDPFGLRRAVTQLIEAAWGWPSPMPAYSELIQPAFAEFDRQEIALDKDKALAAFAEIFASRYAAMMPQVRHDVLDAALLREEVAEVTSPRRVRFRIECLEGLVSDTPFIQTATRPLNIVAAARKKAVTFGMTLSQVNFDALQSADGEHLLEALKAQDASLSKAVAEEKVDEVVFALRALADPINKFFDSTMVMVDDESIRYARLSLLAGCCRQLLVAGDFSKLVIEG